MTRLQHERSIDFAGPIAGYAPGIYEDSGFRFLVTKGPKLIEPKAGDFPRVRKVLHNVLGDDKHNQIIFWHAWLAVAARALYAGQRAPGQAIVLVGPRQQWEIAPARHYQCNSWRASGEALLIHDGCNTF